ncbi:MAG: c-type cytochrome [Nitrospinota bacterium]|nr:c-type cytochrome [Nitrospinota bacterium]
MKLLKPWILVLVGYLLLKIGVPLAGSFLHPGTWPVVPSSVMKMYVFFMVAGALLIHSFSEEGFNSSIGPIVDVYTNPKKGGLRLGVILFVGLFGAYVAYQYVKPTFDAPVELRSVHPAPPSAAKAWGKSYNLQTLKNPLREDTANYAANSEDGGRVYYQNCYFCHGDMMLGKGPYAEGFNPMPANFVDVGTIAQLTESFVFWRISTGGPGLPSEGTPWISAMPIWHTLLSEEEVWKVIIFLYDYTGHKPRVTTEHH